MKFDPGVWSIAADMIEQDGPGAEQKAVAVANLMLEHDDHERHVEWLRVWTAIVLIRAQNKGTVAAVDVI